MTAVADTPEPVYAGFETLRLHGMALAGDTPADLVTVTCVLPVPTVTALAPAGRVKLSPAPWAVMRAGAAADAVAVAACAASAEPTLPVGTNAAKGAAPSGAGR